MGEFSAGELEGWEERAFAGRTEYRIVEVDGRSALRAQSHGAASGLVKEAQVDLRQTPFLRWSWKVERALAGLDERSKGGDDYAARVYVILSGGLRFWETRSLNYVWSGSQPRGSSWPNAFAGNNVVMLAIAGKEDPTGQWMSVKRDLREDLRRYLGVEVERIDAVALMTDTDNSGQSTSAYYGDISFTAD